jgi:uncharacterized phiE125 gp8 family phage protein
MSIQLISAPAVEPVTVALAKAQCRIDGTEFDDLLPIYIKAAREAVEARMNRRLITQTVTQRIDGFPQAEDIELEVGPAQSISQIRYTDAAGDEQVLSSALYSLDAHAVPGYVLRAYGTEWPQTQSIANAVEIDIIVGYGDAATTVPAPARTWILAAVAYQLDNPAAGADQLGMFVDSMLDGVTYREP